MKLLIMKHSHREVNLAADRMVEWPYRGPDGFDEETFQHDFDIVSDFRATHAYPLRAVTTLLRQYAEKIDPLATVYARTKRMSSVIAKLRRYSSMQATTMQDMGGCRAVVSSVEAVAELTAKFREIAPMLNQPKEYNYIAVPKADGYRSVHFVVRYHPRSNSHQWLAPSLTRRIEIQIRSALQHKWATALETIDLFTEQTLKAGGGQYSWKRFLILTSSLFAMNEGCPVVPETVASSDELLQEIRGLWRGIRIRDQFDGWITATQTLIPLEHGTNSTYLIEVNIDRKETTYQAFTDFGQALSAYAHAERKNSQIQGRTAVLVSAVSVNQLRSAFPSYYGDTKAFLDEVEGLIK